MCFFRRISPVLRTSIASVESFEGDIVYSTSAADIGPYRRRKRDSTSSTAFTAQFQWDNHGHAPVRPRSVHSWDQCVLLRKSLRLLSQYLFNKGKCTRIFRLPKPKERLFANFGISLALRNLNQLGNTLIFGKLR